MLLHRIPADAASESDLPIREAAPQIAKHDPLCRGEPIWVGWTPTLSRSHGQELIERDAELRSPSGMRDILFIYTAAFAYGNIPAPSRRRNFVRHHWSNEGDHPPTSGGFVNEPLPILRLKPSSRRQAKPQDSAMDEAEAAKRQKAAELLDELRGIDPDLWHPSNPRPLAVGIHKQIYPVAERINMSRKAVRNFLAWWTRSHAYREALMAPRAKRHNLDGTSAGPVSGLHADQARESEMQRKAS